MSYLEYRVSSVPKGFSKILHLNWALIILVIGIATVGCVMLYSVGGAFSTWAEPQLKRFLATFLIMFIIAMVPIWFWRNMSFLAYGIALLLVVLVGYIGSEGMGAQRWIDLGLIKLQPSELVKLALVKLLIGRENSSKPHNLLSPLISIL